MGKMNKNRGENEEFSASIFAFLVVYGIAVMKGSFMIHGNTKNCDLFFF